MQTTATKSNEKNENLSAKTKQVTSLETDTNPLEKTASSDMVSWGGKNETSNKLNLLKILLNKWDWPISVGSMPGDPGNSWNEAFAKGLEQDFANYIIEKIPEDECGIEDSYEFVKALFDGFVENIRTQQPPHNAADTHKNKDILYAGGARTGVPVQYYDLKLKSYLDMDEGQVLGGSGAQNGMVEEPDSYCDTTGCRAYMTFKVDIGNTMYYFEGKIRVQEQVIN